MSCFFILSVIIISMQFFFSCTQSNFTNLLLFTYFHFFIHGYLPFLIALADKAFYCVTSFWCVGEIQFIIEGCIGSGSAAVTALGSAILPLPWCCSSGTAVSSEVTAGMTQALLCMSVLFLHT